jgi:hypothetical protein
MRCRLEESGPDAPADFINPCLEQGIDEQEAILFAAEAAERINRAVRLDCWVFDG